ncbi:hypothetical protein N309_15076, partial [Tinamus guttatus]
GSAAPPRGQSTSSCLRSWRYPVRGHEAASDGHGDGFGRVAAVDQSDESDSEEEEGVHHLALAGFSRSLQNRCSCLCCSLGGGGACCGSGFCCPALTFWGFLRLGNHWMLLLCWVCP